MPVGATRLPELEQAASHMPFDQFGRYHMLREAVDACRSVIGMARLRILDVGGFFDDHGTPTLPLTRFLPDDDLLVLDVVPCDLPNYVQGDGTALHFADDSFDLVVSADTLEHIPRPRREAFWRELLRVARHGVVLLAPFDTMGVAAAEAVLFEYIKAELHAEHQQLKEHREYGLPDLDRWLQFFQTSGVHARAYPTGYLHAWLGMMLLKHLLLRIDRRNEAQALVDGYYNRYFFGSERRNPAYRHLFVAEHTFGILDAVDAALAPTIMPDVDDPSRDWGIALGPAMSALVQRQLAVLAEHQAEAAQRAFEPVPDLHTVGQLQAQLAAALNDAAQVRDEVRATYEQVRQQQAQHAAVLASQRDEVRFYRQQISMLERILADAQVAQQHSFKQEIPAPAVPDPTHALVVQYETALRDLTERSAWLERQAAAARHELEAVKRGRVLRFVNYVAGRIKA